MPARHLPPLESQYTAGGRQSKSIRFDQGDLHTAQLYEDRVHPASGSYALNAEDAISGSGGDHAGLLLPAVRSESSISAKRLKTASERDQQQRRHRWLSPGSALRTYRNKLSDYEQVRSITIPTFTSWDRVLSK